jgi:hypothetical protein
MSISRGLRLTWVISLIILSIVFKFTLASPGYCDDWVYVGGMDYFEIYYNKTNIKIDLKSKQIKVKIKLVWTENGKIWNINNRIKMGFTIVNFDKLSHTIDLRLYDYDNLKDSLLSHVDYSKSGEVLDSFNNPNPEWNNIVVPKSVGNSILKTILEDYGIKR